jgi:hypothetical protein
MAVKRYAAINIATASLSVHPVHFICDTTAELPVSGLKLGDTALTVDTNTQYKAASATSWTVAGGGGGGGTPAATVVAATSYGQSTVVGVDNDYAREDHSHGSVAHDSHTLLTGVTADQHHADLHGSAKHTGGIVALQEEGAAVASIATLNFVGAGATATAVGTVGTVTIPGLTVAQTVLVVKNADEPVTSSTLLQADNELVFPLAANEEWRATLNLRFDNNGGAGANMKLGMTVPAGCTARWGDQTSNIRTDQTSTIAYDLSSNPTNGTCEATVRLLVLNGATAGNWTLTWAQVASNATALNMRRDSTIVGIRIR